MMRKRSTSRGWRLALLVALVVGGRASAGAILVYNHNAVNDYAQTAAGTLGGPVTVANASSFDTQLALGPWDVVAVDAPSTIPSAGWGALSSYIAGGGRVVMSYWAWNGSGSPIAAFGGSVVASFSLVGRTLEAYANPESAAVFAGVTMPHNTWFNSWSDDGDRFSIGGNTPLAKLTAFSEPVMFLGNGGRTIAAPVLDEWNGADAVTLWANMMRQVRAPQQAPAVPEPGTMALLAAGGVALLRRRRRA